MPPIAFRIFMPGRISGFMICCCVFLFQTAHAQLVQSLDDFGNLLTNTFYYGKSEVPYSASNAASPYSYVLPITFKSTIEFHDYDRLITEMQGFNTTIYKLNYWGEKWSSVVRLDRSELFILDRNTMLTSKSDFRKTCHPDTVINALFRAKADTVRKSWSGKLVPVVVKRKLFSYAAFQTNSNESYEENVDLDGDGIADVKAVYTLKEYQLSASRKAIKPKWFNAYQNCAYYSWVGDAYVSTYNPSTNNFHRDPGNNPGFVYFVCEQSQNLYYMVDAYRVAANFFVTNCKPIAADTAYTRCTPDKREEVTISGSMTPFQFSKIKYWKINSTPVGTGVNYDAAKKRISWTFPASLIESGGTNWISGGESSQAWDQRFQIESNLVELIRRNGCPKINSASYAAQCIAKKARITVNGSYSNFSASRVALNGKTINAVIDPLKNTFRFSLEFNASADDYRLCLYNAANDSLTYSLLVVDIYSACKNAIDSCDAGSQPATPAIRQNITWSLPAPLDNVVTTPSGIAHIIALVETPDIPGVDPVVHAINTRTAKQITIAGLSAVRNDSLDQRRLEKIGPGKYLYSDFVRLDPGINKVVIVSKFQNDSVYSSDKTFVYNSQNSLDAVQSSNSDLFVISVGLNSYADSTITPLRYAAGDASQIDSIFASSTTGFKLYRKVHHIRLIDKEATMQRILDTISRIEVKPEDLIIFFYSGHGFVYRSNFYVTNYDANTAADKITQTCLSAEKLNSRLNDKNCNYMVFIDACQSGAALELWSRPGSKSASPDDIRYARESLEQVLAAKEKVGLLFSSCTEKELSDDSKEYGNGILAEVLLRAFANTSTGNFKPDYDSNGILTTDELQVYLYAAIRKLSNGAQHAQSAGSSRNALPIFLYPH